MNSSPYQQMRQQNKINHYTMINTPPTLLHLAPQSPELDFEVPQLKSSQSLDSTNDQPPLSPVKSQLSDFKIQEDDFCWDFKLNSWCPRGCGCPLLHETEKYRIQTSKILWQYSDIVIPIPRLRSRSFLA